MTAPTIGNIVNVSCPVCGGELVPCGVLHGNRWRPYLLCVNHLDRRHDPPSLPLEVLAPDLALRVSGQPRLL